MINSVIDIGSNSVRLLVQDNGVDLFSGSEVTRLSYKMVGNTLDSLSIKKTAEAVNYFLELSREKYKCDAVVFATEALRKADNKTALTNLANAKIDIIDGETEGLIGFLGAGTVVDGTNLIIDIGGASTEIAIGVGEELIYSKSMPIGVVRILDKCQEDESKILDYINDTIVGYGKIPSYDNAIVIGGTGLNLVSCCNKIIPYDRSKVHLSKMTLDNLKDISTLIKNTLVFDRAKLGINEKRCDLIYGGSLLLIKILEYINCDIVIASEKDNLEGYLKYKKLI